MTSFAKTVSAPPIEADSPRRGFDVARQEPARPEQGQGSAMVENDRPHPAPRPSPDMAADTDRAAFNADWEREQRRAAFIRERTDPQTGGRIRVLGRAFNR